MARLSEEIIVKPELRPCWVNGEKALFHKWIVEEKVFLVFDSPIPYGTKEKIINKFHESDVIPNCCNIKKVMQNFAIVESENGTVDMVSPEEVKFCDSESHFYENEGYWNKEDEKQ